MNAFSIKNKYVELQDFLYENDIDICAITETWLDNSVSSNEFTPEDYVCFRQDRSLDFYNEGTYTEVGRGGALLLVRRNLNPTPYSRGDTDAEVVWCTAHPNPKTELLIGVVYRPERGGEPYLEKVCNSISRIDTDNVILLGDFNFRDIDWDKGEAHTALSRKFLSCIEENMLFQLVKDPTRGQNILDLAFTGNLDIVHSVTVGDKLGSSDHSSVLLELRIPVPRIALTERKIYLYSKGDYSALSNEVKAVDWVKEFASRSMNERWELLKSKYSEWIDKYIPIKTVKSGQRHKPPWINFRSVRRAKKSRRGAAVQARKTGLNAHKEQYLQKKLHTEEVIRQAKVDYESSLINQIKTEPKKFYNYARHFSRSSATIEVLEHDGVKITDNQNKAEILNEFFASVLKPEPLELNLNLPLPEISHDNIVYDIEISPSRVREKLSKLHINKACGPDGIHVNVLRNVPDLDVPLGILFDQSIQTGQIPQEWKDANITPLFKKGSRLSPNNYRPVSLTSQVVKLLERIIYDKLMEHAVDNDMISCHQHGFQKKCSCVTQLLECLYDWTKAYDEAKGMDVIYLDFRKAFDTVPHRRLLYKLKHNGIRGHILNWIEGFLTGRRQRVVLRNGTSRWRSVTSGVPQGSILGPLLFLIFVNDIPDMVLTTAKMFADDTKIYRQITSKDDCDILQRDLNALAAWSKLWLLEFNAEKCVVLRIRAAINYNYSINGVHLQEVTNQKDLGVIISNTLTPNEHVDELVKKARCKIAMFRRCFTALDERKITILYQSIIRPALEYASSAWSPLTKKNIEKLEKVQTKCLRLGNKEIPIETLKERRARTDLINLYKYLNGYYTTPAQRFFSHPNKELRGHSRKVFQRRSRTQLTGHFYTNRVVQPWNNLPEKVVSAPTVATFKSQLRALPLGKEG
eukprot:XP_003728072.1 PREDICTED: RNA-directed DNA polymerase from mobile element jockey-like [Strongylocentrotus purpuratus]